MSSSKDTTTYPTLYKTTTTERQWTIWAKGTHIYESYGVVGGKLTDPKDGKECFVTNKGRSNERSAKEQAIFEAEAKWRGKIAKGYAPKCKAGKKMAENVAKHKEECGSNNRSAKTRDVSKTYIVDKLPKHHLTGIMKGPEYKGQDISSGGYAQPKYDGVRCKATSNGEMGVMTSTGFNQFPHLKHIKDAICKELNRYEEQIGTKLVLDGELYCHRLFDEDGTEIVGDVFNKFITSCGKPSRSTPHPLEKQLIYVIFDVHTTDDQATRIGILEDFFSGVTSKYLEKAPTHFVKTKEKMEKYMDKFIADGYEGLIFRYDDRFYIDKKKTGKDAPCFKYKKMQDEEFKVIGCKQGRGTAKDRIIWQCETSKGIKFDAAQDGTTEDCKKMFERQKKYIGKMLTVKFQDYTKSGKPRFPIAKAFRDYE